MEHLAIKVKIRIHSLNIFENISSKSFYWNTSNKFEAKNNKTNKVLVKFIQNGWS